MRARLSWARSSTAEPTRSWRTPVARHAARRAVRACSSATGLWLHSATGGRSASNGSPTEPKPSKPPGCGSRRCRGRTWKLSGARLTPTTAETATPGSAPPEGSSSGPDAVGPHHLVVLVLHDVAVPDEQPGAVEGRLDAGDLARIGDH